MNTTRLASSGAASQARRGFVGRPHQAGRAIDDLDLVAGPPAAFSFVSYGSGLIAFARAAGRDDRNAAAGGELVDELAGPVLGLVEQRAFQRFVAHAQAVVDDDHRVQRLAVVEFLLPRGKIGPGQRQAEQQHRRRPQDEQHDVANLQDAAVALQGLPQKVHRRPLHHAIPPAIQQMNDDRPRGAESRPRRRTARR